jgi:hypothetical protein
MIDRHRLARACADNDRTIERSSSRSIELEPLGIKTDDATYVAMQRGLRFLSILIGTDAAKLTLSDLKTASKQEQQYLTAIAAGFMDGLAAAARIFREDEEPLG